MATIHNPQLTITTNRLENRASIVTSCDVELTDFEVNAMNLLGLPYTLDCRLLNKDLQYEDTVIRYDRQNLPRFADAAARSEHIVFETVAAMSDLHEHVFTKDKLVAEFTLRNQETGAEEVTRSDVVTVDLVA